MCQAGLCGRGRYPQAQRIVKTKAAPVSWVNPASFCVPQFAMNSVLFSLTTPVKNCLASAEPKTWLLHDCLQGALLQYKSYRAVPGTHLSQNFSFLPMEFNRTRGSSAGPLDPCGSVCVKILGEKISRGENVLSRILRWSPFSIKSRLNLWLALRTFFLMYYSPSTVLCSLKWKETKLNRWSNNISFSLINMPMSPAYCQYPFWLMIWLCTFLHAVSPITGSEKGTISASGYHVSKAGLPLDWMTQDG